jgi:N-acetylglutamate synthase
MARKTSDKQADHAHLARVRGLEERAFNAWPALQTILMDGWVLRFSGGFTKRANSVNAWAPSSTASEIADAAGPLYASQGLPLIMRLSPLAGPTADAELGARSFARVDETIVMTASLAHAAADPHIVLTAKPTAAWLDGFSAANGAANGTPAAHNHTHAAMLGQLRCPAAFATAMSDGKPAGFGMAAAERGMVGLFDIVTVEAARRQGIGWRVASSLMAWGQTQGASAAYLQVVASNAPAASMYATQGFTEAYRYHYRIAPNVKVLVV